MPSGTPPGCGPVEYLERLQVLGPTIFAVHGVQMDNAYFSHGWRGLAPRS